jgi:hypothetical protein
VDPDVCFWHYTLCSRHFDESQIVGTRLIPNAVPSKFEWNGYLNEQQEIIDESINSEPDRPQVEVTEHCSPIDWSQIQSTSTPQCKHTVICGTFRDSKLVDFNKISCKKFNWFLQFSSLYSIINQFFLSDYPRPFQSYSKEREAPKNVKSTKK